ncbi:hypothetical protein [Rhizobium sp. 21-4511-3d]
MQINLFGKVIGRFRWGGLSRKTARKMMLFEEKADANVLHDMISFASKQKLLYRPRREFGLFRRETQPHAFGSASPRQPVASV